MILVRIPRACANCFRKKMESPFRSASRTDSIPNVLVLTPVANAMEGVGSGESVSLRLDSTCVAVLSVVHVCNVCRLLNSYDSECHNTQQHPHHHQQQQHTDGDDELVVFNFKDISVDRFAHDRFAGGIEGTGLGL